MMLRILLLLTATLLWAAETTPPSLIPGSKIEPKYTDAARDAKISGDLLVEVHIDAEGIPTEVKVLKALGYGLDENATDAVRQWRFSPATREGKPVATIAKVEISFRLKDKDSPSSERNQ